MCDAEKRDTQAGEENCAFFSQRPVCLPEAGDLIAWMVARLFHAQNFSQADGGRVVRILSFLPLTPSSIKRNPGVTSKVARGKHDSHLACSHEHNGQKCAVHGTDAIVRREPNPLGFWSGRWNSG
ncbi:MAG: GNAT family N-acetyltransferase [Trueperella sp.]|nr:GNAT family N-acetyltransferase [Trueperella sp.]